MPNILTTSAKPVRSFLCNLAIAASPSTVAAPLLLAGVLALPSLALARDGAAENPTVGTGVPMEYTYDPSPSTPTLSLSAQELAKEATSPGVQTVALNAAAHKTEKSDKAQGHQAKEKTNKTQNRVNAKPTDDDEAEKSSKAQGRKKAEPSVDEKISKKPSTKELAKAKGAKKEKSQDSDQGKGQLHQSGIASWYGPGFHGRLTANGEIFNKNALTAAHLRLAFGTRVRVKNLNNGRSVVVRINDRGPYIKPRIIDLSHGAARQLGISGLGRVALYILK